MAKKLKILKEEDLKKGNNDNNNNTATTTTAAITTNSTDTVQRTVKKAPIVESDSSEDDVPLADIVKKIREKKEKKEKEKKEKAIKKVEKPATFSTSKSEKQVIKAASSKDKQVAKVPSAKDKQIIAKTPKKKKEEAAADSQSQEQPEDGSNDEEDDEYKWWENPVWDDTIKWETLEHNGVFFPPEYQPHGVKMIYNGKEIYLEPEAEEVAGFFAALLETDYARNPTFVKNFFDDFLATLERIKSSASGIIKEFSKCDFTPMFRHFENLKAIKKQMTKEEKNKIKDEKKALDEEFGFCLLDGRKEKVGNYRIEPPGLFRGRGQHPKTGKLKLRVRPEDITINIGKNAKVPNPPPGHHWKDIVHNNTVTWLATWTENINGVPKYVQLGATSSLKGKSDYKKFETARRLKHHIASIRAKNAEELRSKEMAVRQRATALWLIDHLAIRAGNEKGDDEADTVGCCSLRLEHVKLNPSTSEVTFDFLGKDSIRYLNTVKVDPVIIKNLAIFMRAPKTQSHMIFDRLDTSMLNSYLTSLMPGLTAKVFRTYNASFTMQKELDKVHDQTDAPVAEKILSYNRANREVAILCNHQRAVAKSHEQSMSKLNEKIMHLKYHRLLLKRKLYGEKEAEESDFEDEATEQKVIEEIEALEMEKYRKKCEKEGKEVDPTYKPPTPCPAGNKTLSPEALEKRIASLSVRIQAARHQATDREENKTTALGTSKINYIDPRITAAWCKTHNVPIEKMFTKTLRDKFKWAMDVSGDWRF